METVNKEVLYGIAIDSYHHVKYFASRKAYRESVYYIGKLNYIGVSFGLLGYPEEFTKIKTLTEDFKNQSLFLTEEAVREIISSGVDDKSLFKEAYRFYDLSKRPETLKDEQLFQYCKGCLVGIGFSFKHLGYKERFEKVMFLCNELNNIN